MGHLLRGWRDVLLFARRDLLADELANALDVLACAG